MNYKAFVVLLLPISLLITGCVNLNNNIVATKLLPLPESDQKIDLLKQMPVLGAVVTGKSSAILEDKKIPIGTNYTVTIHYQDKPLENNILAGGAINKALGLGASLISSDSGIMTHINRYNLVDLVKMAGQVQTKGVGMLVESNLYNHLEDLLSNQLATVAIKQTTNLVVNISFDAMVAAYLNDYLNGTFVDRNGTAYTKPDIEKMDNAATVSLVKVLLEASFDYSMMTPLAYSTNTASTNNTPTFAALFPQLHELTSSNPNQRGITETEFNLINYWIGSQSKITKTLSELLIKAFGGGSVGIKISTGDNSTLSAILSALCSDLAERVVYEESYDFFEKFEYAPSTSVPWGYLPSYNENKANMFLTDSNAQDLVAIILANQEQIKSLSQGGWKFTLENTTNYTTLANSILSIDQTAQNQTPFSTSGLVKRASDLLTQKMINKADGQAFIKAVEDAIPNNPPFQRILTTSHIQ